jgi:predicted regulator of Ras-like GTPase activity (Roadblock/LC7/MglB family)
MSFLLWTWIFSLTGALLFFGAGVVFKARSIVVLDGALAREQPDTTNEVSLAERQARCAALEREVERHNTDRALLARELDSARQLVEEHRRTASAEAEGLRARLHELSKHGDDASTAALKHELALSRETARTQAEQLEELRQDKARLQNVEADLAGSKRENARLTDQVRDLRAQAYASKTPPMRRIDAPERNISTLGSALQSIVDNEAQSSSVRNAVIADELGLLVAASGSSHEYCDALAALGAYLADVGTKTRDVLPLHEVRQVVVRDDRDMTLTVRPLAASEPGLALVTLAVEPQLTVTHS